MQRARKLLPRLLGAAGLTAALVAVITAFSTLGYAASPQADTTTTGTTAGTTTAATSTAATTTATTTTTAAPAPPKNETAPSISGSQQPKPGDLLTANPGAWASDTTPTFTYQWERCNTTGGACQGISGATSQTYTVQQGDVGSTLRVAVTAKNSHGSTSASSPQTSIVQAQPAPPPPAKTIAATNVNLPDRLTVDKIQFTPSVIRSRRAFAARFHVVNTKGQSVSGALVYALGLPYSWARNATEAPTDANGWATITLKPTRNMPLRRGGALVIFVRARVPGQSLLAGASTRRLVQATIR